MMIPNFTQRVRLSALLLGSLILVGCAGKSRGVVGKDYFLDIEDPLGLMYGKVIHQGKYGDQFKIWLKKAESGTLASIDIKAYGDKETSFVIALDPGEWMTLTLNASSGPDVNLQDRGAQALVVEAGHMNYVGTWDISGEKVRYFNQKKEQDDYIRRNYPNLNPYSARISKPQ